MEMLVIIAVCVLVFFADPKNRDFINKCKEIEE